MTIINAIGANSALKTVIAIVKQHIIISKILHRCLSNQNEIANWNKIRAKVFGMVLKITKMGLFTLIPRT
jgi:hypothetical protein